MVARRDGRLRDDREQLRVVVQHLSRSAGSSSSRRRNSARSRRRADRRGRPRAMRVSVRRRHVERLQIGRRPACGGAPRAAAATRCSSAAETSARCRSRRAGRRTRRRARARAGRAARDRASLADGGGSSWPNTSTSASPWRRMSSPCVAEVLATRSRISRERRHAVTRARAENRCRRRTGAGRRGERNIVNGQPPPRCVSIWCATW